MGPHCQYGVRRIGELSSARARLEIGCLQMRPASLLTPNSPPHPHLFRPLYTPDGRFEITHMNNWQRERLERA